VEVPFSRDVGCYTPPTSPTRAPSSSPSASSDKVASSSPTLRVVPCVPAPRRSTRHSVAEDGSSATDEDTMQKAMRHKADINLDFV
jgi:hypothetical protein